MKKTVLIFLCAIILEFPFILAASAYEAYEIRGLSLYGYIEQDGSLRVVQSFTVNFDNESESFSYEIPLSDDEYYAVTGVDSISASMDGVGCTLISEPGSGDEVPSGTYSVTASDDTLTVTWYYDSATTVELYLLYTLAGAVKSVDEEAFLGVCLLDGSFLSRCVDGEILIYPPSGCEIGEITVSAESIFTWIYKDDCLLFNESRTLSAFNLGLSMPLVYFSGLSVIELPEEFNYIPPLIVLAVVILALITLFFIFLKKIIRRIYISKSCAATDKEPSREEQMEAVGRLSAATVFKTMVKKRKSGADVLICTVMDLMSRKILRLDSQGFSRTDETAELRRSEEQVIAFLTGETAKTPKEFYRFAKKYERKNHSIPPATLLTRRGRRDMLICCDIYVTGQSAGWLNLEKIALAPQDFPTLDILTALAGEQEKTETGILSLRRVYDAGREATSG